MKEEEYIKNYRQIRVFKVQFQFTKNNDMPIIPRIGYFLAFDMGGALKECIQQYCRGDQKYVEVLYLEDCGFPNGIHHFV